MANLTITVRTDVLKQARMRALAEDTSVNALLAEYLARYANSDNAQRRRSDAVARLLQLSKDSNSASGGARWTREDLHER
jgi:hypothetical protein